MMPSNMQMELIDFNIKPILKTKFYELSSALGSSVVINFWRSLACDNSPEIRKFAHSHICGFGMIYTC